MATPMYERFTDPARKVMQLANQEAQRYRHEYIGTEHILLGMIEEGSGLAVTILKNLSVNPQTIRTEVQEIVRSGRDKVSRNTLLQTPRSKRIIEYAMEEARGLHHNYVGTEHLLLGLIREAEGVAGQVLLNFGVRLDDARNEVIKVNKREPGAPNAHQSPTADGERPRFGARAIGRFVGHVARAIGVGDHSSDHSAIGPTDPKDLEAEIERLTVAKEEAVAKMDFKRAAELRDQADELKRRIP
jgi:Clp amino terminal domain, pathogenicity island component/UvrB/uvrC motif